MQISHINILYEYILITTNVAMKATILYYKIQSVCVSVSMFGLNRLQNHVYYGDEAFVGDSVTQWV